MQTQDSSKTYQKAKDIIFFVGVGLDVAILFVLHLSGLSFWLRDLALTYSSNIFIVNGIYITVFAIGMYVLHFPLCFFIQYVWEHKFKLSNQSFTQWFGDDLKKNIFGLFIALILIEAIYLFLSKFPQQWWILAALFWLFLTLVLARIAPTLIIPMFYKYSNITDQQLRTQILNLFKKCQVKIKDVYTIDLSSKTKKANAFICGLGESRRVVLSDTLLKDFSHSEIETVVAHELGHYKHRDILKLTLINSVVILAVFFMIDQMMGIFDVQPIDDIAYLPLLSLIFLYFTLLTMPLLNGISRYVEVQADRFSLELTKSPNDFITMIEKLGKMNLAEFKPSKFNEIFFYDHPPIGRRIEFAKTFLSANDGDIQ